MIKMAKGECTVLTSTTMKFSVKNLEDNAVAKIIFFKDSDNDLIP